MPLQASGLVGALSVGLQWLIARQVDPTATVTWVGLGLLGGFAGGVTDYFDIPIPDDDRVVLP
jgi:hypothetical protein